MTKKLTPMTLMQFALNGYISPSMTSSTMVWFMVFARHQAVPFDPHIVQTEKMLKDSL